MSTCNGLPIIIDTGREVSPKDIVEKLMLLDFEDDPDFPIRSFLAFVKDDPALSISLTPIISEEGVRRWSHVCEISSHFYKTRTFNVLIK